MRHWGWWLFAGIVSFLGGIFALANPLAATLTAELVAAYSLIAVGVLIVISAFGDRGWGGRIMAILLGLAILFLGFNLAGKPLVGVVSLTFLSAFALLVIGVFRILLAMNWRDGGVRWVLILSGALSLVLAFMIFSNWPQSAALMLGLFLAVELMSNGLSLITLAMARKSRTTEG